MFFILWLYQKSLQVNSSSFNNTKRIRCNSKTNSTKRIHWRIKKLGADGNATDAGNDQSIFVNFIKFKETRLNFSQGSTTVL